MGMKTAKFKILGMNRDLSESSFNPDFAYENINIRVLAKDKNTQMSISNERGNLNSGIELDGVVLGEAHIGNDTIVFTTSDSSADSGMYVDLADNKLDGVVIDNSGVLNTTYPSFDISNRDKIYRLMFDESTGKKLLGGLLYSGNLGFKFNKPIETLSIYENNNIKKIYWTDGINQPRVINIAPITNNPTYNPTNPINNTRNNIYNNYSFDFTQKMQLNEVINIKKVISGSGTLAPGTIQYCFSYYNKFMQETNLFYTSSLYYITFSDRGGAPDAKISNSFQITIGQVDTRFQYLRIYSIHRSSQEGTPECKIVTDLKVNGPSISFIDNGTTGSIISPTQLLYIGGEEVVFGTMTQKDNTLFYGDITLKRERFPKEINSILKSLLQFVISNKSIPNSNKSEGSFYRYTNQLNLSSKEITTFKQREYYRLGVQFQHYSGKWSEPIWIKDEYIQIPPIENPNSGGTEVVNITAILTHMIPSTSTIPTIEGKNIYEYLSSKGYIRIRPLVVYPEVHERSVLMQGLINPTMYNLEDRLSNSPFSVSSWFSRPINDYPNTDTLNRSKGSQISWHHNEILPINTKSSCEIQCNQINQIIYSATPSEKETILPRVHKDSKPEDVLTTVKKAADLFAIDQSIVSLYSPELEFDESFQNADTSSWKFRLVGSAQVNSNVCDIDVITSTGMAIASNTKVPLRTGLFKFNRNSTIGNNNKYAGNSLLGTPMFDSFLSARDPQMNGEGEAATFVLYPWHRNGSLNNCSAIPNRPSMIKTKRWCNAKFCNCTTYLTEVWNALGTSAVQPGITKPVIFNSDEITAIKIPSPKNSELGELLYYGNVDKIISTDSYDITIGGILRKSQMSNIRDSVLSDSNSQIITLEAAGTTAIPTNDIDNKSIDPISIRYKSCPHAVFSFNWNKISTNPPQQVTLPNCYDKFIATEVDSYYSYFYNHKAVGVSSGSSVVTDSLRHGPTMVGGEMEKCYFWIGEFYRDVDPTTLFGGISDFAFQNNKWTIAGDSVALPINTGLIQFDYTEGDTYFQRYDCLRTMPMSTEDTNQIIDIVSFVCETRVNIDGRYDRNRGLVSNLNTNKQNFNLLNKSYTQKNNYFIYRILDDDRFNINSFPNLVSWSKTKTFGELTDSWSSVNLLSTLDLDGDKGKIRSLNTFNNNILGFQDRGIFNLLFNSRTQLATNSGVPVEIANSGKVDGKIYISERIGTRNKWSICETSTGIYFIDNYSKGIFRLTDTLTNLSDTKGFHSWINEHSNNIYEWDPIKFNNFKTFYDGINKDVYFVNNNNALCFNESLDMFTSFFSYGRTPFMFNLDDEFISIKEKSVYDKRTLNPSRIWIQNKGDYNSYFGKLKPFSTTVIVNPDIALDKIFNTLEFRSDSWNIETNNELLQNSETFNYLEVWNEYQKASTDLSYNEFDISNLKKKFRVWRADIPRAKELVSGNWIQTMNRMRNTWMYLKLGSKQGSLFSDLSAKRRTVLHDLVVHYTD